jgi:hypothetical protein
VFCDVCGREFAPDKLSQRRCSDRCREFAQRRKGCAVPLPQLWAELRAREMAAALGICPCGKVRHQRKADAEKAARSAVRARYRGLSSWLRVYPCDRCFGGWHLTSKPAKRPARPAGALRS